VHISITNQQTMGRKYTNFDFLIRNFKYEAPMIKKAQTSMKI